MGHRVISEGTVIARKRHNETFSEWFRNDLLELNGIGLSFKEWRSIVMLRNNNWDILPGQKCEWYSAIDCDGQIYKAYYLKEIEDIVRKFDLADFEVC